MPHRLAADIGGTFTDLVLFDELTGELRVHKTPSTPNDFTEGVLTGVWRTLREGQAELAGVERFVHGATVVLNALLQRRLPLTGLVTTAGFRDVLEIMRTNNPFMYDLQYVKPAPLVPRRLRFEVRERMRHTGEVHAPLVEQDVRDAAAALSEAGVRAVAVCLLHAYANPTHELRVAELLREELPGVTVCTSADVAPEWREFERTSTTVVNAATVPVISSYLGTLAERLREQGLAHDLQVMQSSGGILGAEAATRRPVRTVMSGPSGGVVGAMYLAQRLGLDDVVTIDIGGTSSDMGVIAGGRAVRVEESAIDRWPILAPMIEILSIGAGGGSIASVDAGGALRIGPESAGAEPGAVCYGRGGTEPTVTDANLVLGRLDPLRFLAGEMALDVAGAERALRERVAQPLGLDVPAAAEGIIRIASTTMAKAMRSILVERGHDPRDFTLMAFGGAGGLHAGVLMRELGIPRAVVPNNPGALSAIGMLATDVRHDHARTHVRALAETSPEELRAIFAELEREALATVADEGEAADAVVSHSLDLRYLGQEYHLNLPVVPRALDFDDLARRLHEAHERTYGYATPEFPVQLAHLRVAVVSATTRPELPTYPRRDGGAAPVRTLRRVFFTDLGAVETPVYDVDELRAGDVFAGPAIIEDPRSTVVVLPGQNASVDALRDIVLTEDTGNAPATNGGGAA